MGIRFECPNGHKLHVKSHLAGKRGICPDCGAKVVIPAGENGYAGRESQPAVVGTEAAPTEISRHAESPQPSVVIRTVGDLKKVASGPPSIEVPRSTVATGPPLVQPRTDLWYVRPQTGGQFGPATDDVLKSWIAAGRVTEDALVWREGWAEWKPAREAADALPIQPAALPVAPEPIVPVPIAAESVATSPPPVLPEAAPAEPPAQPPAEAVMDAAAEVQASPSLTRRRRARSRSTLALVLLLTAVVLGILLVWVLVRNPAQASVLRRVDGAQLVQSFDRRYVADFRHPT